MLARAVLLLEAVDARDEQSITALLHEDHSVMTPNESHSRQPRATDLLVGDPAAAAVTYDFTVDGTRSLASYLVELVWFREGVLARGERGLVHAVTPDADVFESTYSPAPFEGTEQDPAASRFGVGDCDPSWVSMSQALDLHDEPGSPVCLHDGTVLDTFAPEVRAGLALPAGERSFELEVVQTQLTQVVWSDDLPLSEWLIGLDGREYVAVVVGAQDGTGRVVAVVPTT